MRWNNGKERANFEKEQAEKRKKYLAAGMSEEEIQTLLNFDKDYLRSQRREAMHTQRLNIPAFAESESIDDSKSPLLKKFLHSFTVEDKHFESERFGWIEQIENQPLYETISALSDFEKEILTELLYDGFTQEEIAESLGRNQSSISRRIAHLKKILKNFL